MTTLRALTTLAMLLAVLVPTTAPAQYFGRNKVQYEDFDFQVLKSDHFDIYYYEREREAVAHAARLAERWHARLAGVLQHQLRGRQPVILYASHPDFVQTTAIQGIISEGTGGVTEGLRRRVVLPFTGSLGETSHVLGHELVHAFQFDMGAQRTLQLPLWFVEGMAEYLSLGPVHAPTAVWLRDAVLRDELPTLDELDDPDVFPYRFGHAAWAYISGRWGDEMVRDLFIAASETGDPIGALETFTGVSRDLISDDWHAAVRRTYAELDLTGVRPAGTALITETQSEGEVNIGPSLSPDSSRLVFLSEQDRFSIDMYLADATTGEIRRKLTETATSPHIDSIQFLQSAGAWSPDGRQFAIAAVREGRALLRIIDPDTGDTIRDIPFDAIGEVLHPAWSPDGRRVAVTGMAGGLSDLYLVTVDTGEIQQVTADAFADLQPAWLPNGRALVFATDRFTTNLDALSFGEYRLARIDVGSRAITALPGFPSATHTNPQAAPDGQSVYFLSNPNGIPNVYRLTLADGSLAPITTVTTGVTGITAESPALSVAAKTGALAYTVRTDGNYAIYRIDQPQASPRREIAQVTGAVLPPERRATNAVAQVLDQARTGLPPANATFSVAPYEADLGLNYVGATAATSVGADEFGARLGGGVSLIFGDILNEHLLGASFSSNGGLQDIGGQLAYLNQTSRWHWGASVERVPYRSGLARRFLDDVDGGTAIVEQVEIFRQIHNEASLVTQYPFNRSTRIELSGGARLLTFDHELQTQLFSPSTGGLIGESTRDLSAPESLTLGQASAAFVHDTSVLGATGPVLGTRSRLEITPVFGDIQFSEFLADYRRYFSPAAPFTIAGRLLHLGRYGADADSGRLNPLFLGYPSLVRGYDVGSFDARECEVGDGDGSNCPAFDRLLGSRMLVANLELRFPLVGAFTGEFEYGPVPVEGVVFGDAGVAWTSDDSPSFAGGDRDLVRSVGAGIRVNAFGFAVLEFAAVRPFDRPDESWRFVFALRPGF